jgi:hypothetical protein
LIEIKAARPTFLMMASMNQTEFELPTSRQIVLRNRSALNRLNA